MSATAGCKDYRHTMYTKNIYNEISKNLAYRNIKLHAEA